MKRPFVASSSGDLPAVMVNRLIDLSTCVTDVFSKPRHDPRKALLLEITLEEGLLTTDCPREVEVALEAATEVAMFAEHTPSQTSPEDYRPRYFKLSCL